MSRSSDPVSRHQRLWSVHLGEAAGGLGLAADPFDRDAFAHQLEAAIEAPIDLPGARRQCEQLSWKAIAGRYIDLYESVVP